MNYTNKVLELSKELDVQTSVAMDILYLRSLEKRIILAAQNNSALRDFEVHNEKLEQQLDKLGC